MNAPVVEFDAVTKRYGDKPAVDGLSLALHGGEIFAFLGPNGAGKTTTIKLLCGLLKPTAGTIRIEGREFAGEALDLRRRLGYVPDQPFLYEKLTGREFLEFIRELYSLAPAEAKARSDRLVEELELGDFIDDLAETYSHGMRQRLAFAGALLPTPKALVLDEPMVGLDPQSARRVKKLVREEAGKGNCVFMSTHTLSMAEEIADRIGIIRRGRLVRCGALADLRREFGGERSLEDFFLEVTAESAP